MNKFFQNTLGKISVKMVILISFFFMLTYSISMSLIYFHQKDTIINNSYNNLEIIANLKKNQLQRWVEERRDDLSVLANNRLMLNFLKNSGVNKKYVTNNINLIKEKYGVYKKIYITNLFGKILASTDNKETGNKIDNYFLQKIKQNTGISYRKVYSHEGNAVFNIAQKIMDFSKDNPVPYGIVVFVISIDDLINPMLLDREGMGKTGEILLVDENSLSLIELRWKNNSAMKYTIKARPALLASRGNEGIIESYDYRNEKVIAAYRHLPFMRWGMVVKYDKKELLAHVNDLLQMMLIIFFTGLIIFINLSYIIARTITKPVRFLNSAAMEVASGRYDVSINESSGGELGQLAKSFNIMSTNLNNQFRRYVKIQEISQALVEKTGFRELLSKSLKKIADFLNCQTAVFYQYNENTEILNPIVNYAGNQDNYSDFKLGSGMVGESAKTGKIMIVDNIPDDTGFVLKTGEMDIKPRSIINIPVIFTDDIIGVLVLSTIYDIKEEIFDNIKMFTDQFAIALNNSLNYQLLLNQTEEIKNSNIELTSANIELQNQSGELEKQTVELKLQQKNVEESNRLKSEFLSNMSHELRTPLNSILALSQGMLSREKSSFSGEEREYLEIIERNGRNLLSLINDILDLSKIEAGRIVIRNINFTIYDLVHACLASIKPLAEKKGLEIHCSIDENLLPIYGDMGKLKQILLNVMSNAVKFTEQGHISIKGIIANDFTEITISDTGIGIKEYDIENIFDEFRQIDGSTTRRFEGTGLGLSISNKLINILGGNIEVNSIYGSGSTFIVKFPVKAKDSIGLDSINLNDIIKNEKYTKQINDIAKNNKINKILIVEDNKDAVIQIKGIMDDLGVETEIAENGEEALEIIKKIIPSGIILDLMMPGMDGFEVLKRIRSKENTKDIPVLILTAKDLTVEDYKRLKHNNIHQLIFKGSIDRDELLFKIDSLFSINVNTTQIEKQVVVQKNDKTTVKKNDQNTILVIEDNPDSRKSINLLLEEVDCSIIEADNGKDGLIKAKEVLPALILLDIHLPDISGYDIFNELKKNSETDKIPLVAVTAKAMKGDSEKIMELGFNDYISKPVNKKKLIDIVKKYL